MNEYAYSGKTAGNKKVNTSRLILTITACVAGLGLIFFLSFYISYNRISADRKLNRSEKEIIAEQTKTIEAMKEELGIKEEKIETLMMQIKKQEAAIADLKGKDEYSKMIADELKNLPKETRSNTQPTQTKPEPSDSSTPPKQSEVQKDIYIKPTERD